jgi:hypothetical protein
MTASRPPQVYCQRIIGPGPKFCPRKAVAPDPLDPKRSVCTEHSARSSLIDDPATNGQRADFERDLLARADAEDSGRRPEDG